MKNKYYYNVEDDIKEYPDAWCYLVIGGRNTGKTYGTLKSCYVNNRQFTFIKRTIEDVSLLCAGNGRIGSKQNEYGVDLSPFKSINRDLGSNVKAFSIFKGLGGFWKMGYSDEDEEIPDGSPIGYITSLNAVNKVKGFDLSDSEWLIFDEFIPQPWERINRKEGEQVMDLYKTVSRDREHRGQDALKLICLANATNVFNPLMEILEVTDVVVDMQANGDSICFLEDRGILIHMLNDNAAFKEQEKKSKIYKAMEGTAWGSMALDNEFAYDDFTNVKRVSLKGYQPYIKVIYKNHEWYIYIKDGYYYCCSSRSNSINDTYDLNIDNDVQRFFATEYFNFKEACYEGRFAFQKYTMYRVLIKFKEIFKV